MDFEPAHRATAWLQTNISANRLPLDTYLVIDEPTLQLRGFFVTEPIEVSFDRDDLPIIELREKAGDPAEPQKAMKLVWIARSASSEAGFGQELFTAALVYARLADAVALIVEPFNTETARKIWIEHYQMREPRPKHRDEDWIYLWHPTQPLKHPDLWG